MLHIRILDTDHASHPVAIGGDLGAAQHPGASAGLHPVGRGARLTGGAGHGDVATEADDVVEIQLFGQHLVQFLIAEAAVGHDAHLDPRRQQLGQPDQHAMLVEAAALLERALVDGQPYQGCRATVVADQGQHDGGLVVGVEVGPIHGHHDGAACADDEGHPAHQNIVDADGSIGRSSDILRTFLCD